MGKKEAKLFEVSLVMKKPALCICENKGADKLCSNRTADQRLSFRYIDSIAQIQNFTPLPIFCGYTSRFVSKLVGNPGDRFSSNEAHLKCKAVAQVSGYSVIIKEHSFFLF